MGDVDKRAPLWRVSLLVLTILMVGASAQQYVDRSCTSVTNSECSVPKSAEHSSRSLGQRRLRSSRLATPRDDEVAILMAFRRAVNDTWGMLNGWNASRLSPCHWYGVTCDTAGQHVTTLRLNTYSSPPFYLEGTISPELGGLKFLETLDLSYNGFTGSIPPALGNCSRLSILNLGGNLLGGEIPKELGRLPNLTYFRISSYDLGYTGAIPASLSNCSNLRTLDVQSDSLFTQRFPSWMGSLTLLSELILIGFLIGEIPPSIGNFSSLTVLKLSNNQLTTIPREIGLLSRLQELNLDQNHLSGSFPASVGNLSKLTGISFADNNLTGPLPPAVMANLSMSLEWFDISRNHLSGSIPVSSFTSLANIFLLEISSNYFSGPVPHMPVVDSQSSIAIVDYSFNSFTRGEAPAPFFNGSFDQVDLSHNRIEGSLFSVDCRRFGLRYLYLDNNHFTGSFPSELTNCTTIIGLRLNDNLLSGTLPAALGRIFLNGTGFDSFLDLSNNNFSGQIPVSLGMASKLAVLRLNNNSLTGPVFVDFRNLSSLILLRISDNQLSGTIPRSLENCTALQLLDLSNDGFSGKVPDFAYQLPSLGVLWLNNNSLTGPVLVDFRNLSSLTSLKISDNQLSGTIPKSLENCTRLRLLDLSNNRFSGNVPDFAYQLPSLRVLKLGSNRLEGDILPAWIFGLPQLQVLDLSYNLFNGSIPVGLAGLQGMIQIQPNSGSPTHNTTLQEQITLDVKGSNQTYEYILLATTYLDLSNNFFSGEIPPSLGDLLGLKFLNLANNNLSGFINASLAIPGLESLDLSGNDLSGPIPSSFYDLSSLGDLGLSRNNLSGSILGTKFDASHYLPGNNLLCGVVINRSCPLPGPGPVSYPLNSSDNSEFSDIMSLAAVEVGAALGFVSVGALLVLSDKARTCLFALLPPRHRSYIREYGLFSEN